MIVLQAQAVLKRFWNKMGGGRGFSGSKVLGCCVKTLNLHKETNHKETIISSRRHSHYIAMQKGIKKLVAIFFIFVAFFVLLHLLFLAVYHNQIEGFRFTDIFRVVRHGWSMDNAMAGYFTALPCLFAIASQWTQHRALIIAERCYFGIASVALAIVAVLDLILYGYWGFRLDTTPLFYFSTSPSAALASAEWWQYPLAIVAVGLIATGLYKALSLTLKIKPDCKRRVATTIVFALLTGALFITIRGGLTVATMNLSRVYFSQNQKLNHAAINPFYSFMQSALHQGNFANQYRFMSDEDATAAINALNSESAPGDTIALSTTRPEIYLVILESFAADLMETLNGDAVAVNLDKIANEGVLFTNFYANSFRTDRSLPAILAGFPSQPSTSLMKFTSKTEHIPGIANELKRVGYESHYYYGGDVTFANMKSFLVNSGFEHFVSDNDFTLVERASKWGAHDDLLFQHALADATANSGKTTDKPRINVIQTSSSHEPFKVPYANPRFADNAVLNAFAFTDSCLMAFVDGLKRLPNYNNTLLVIVPDHLGTYLQHKHDKMIDRHHVPLILAGGAVCNPGTRIATPGSQNDIAATLLGLLNLDYSMFDFSHNMLSSEEPHYAVMCEPSAVGLVTGDSQVAVDSDTEAVLSAEGSNTEQRVKQAKAYLQLLYNKIASL
jgi:phosphoglycerol transferase MdoB-like AlkP superfamily enzyme